MATSGKDLSSYNPNDVPNGTAFSIAIVRAEWNHDITSALYNGAIDTLLANGVKESNITSIHVPGAFELPVAAKWVIEQKKPDAVIVIGCVIQGETKHFDFVCNGVTQGVMDLNLSTGVPVIFCVLTDNTHQQSVDRSGGKHGNKGIECAVAALKMAAIRKEI